MILEDDLRTPDKAAMRRELHRPIEWTFWKRLTKPFWFGKYMRLHSQELQRMYPNGLTDEQLRRVKDLQDPYAEYAIDDPRKYGIYNQGTRGFVAPPGADAFFYKNPQLDIGQGHLDLFTRYPHITKDEFRRLRDRADPRELYDSDDPRRYGVYGVKPFAGYTPSAEDLDFNGNVFQFRDSPEGPPRIVDTTHFSLEQYRKLFDLGDSEAEYQREDSRGEGLYGSGVLIRFQ